MKHKSLLGTLLGAAQQQQSFYSHYDKTFQVVRANTDELRERAFRLRCNVYCVENHFCAPPETPAELERDAFDDRAVHHLMIHRDSGDTAGTVRVSLPEQGRPLSSFELQGVCDHPLLQIDSRALRMAEISRLCMAERFRRRPRDGRILPAYYEQEWNEPGDRKNTLAFFRRRIPYAPLGLLAAAFETVLDSGRMDCVMAIDPADFRNLKRTGLVYKILGPRVNFMGSQQPVVFSIKNALDNMVIENRECWEIAADRGRIHAKANTLQQNQWQDGIFDDLTKEMILRKLI